MLPIQVQLHILSFTVSWPKMDLGNGKVIFLADRVSASTVPDEHAHYRQYPRTDPPVGHALHYHGLIRTAEHARPRACALVIDLEIRYSLGTENQIEDVVMKIPSHGFQQIRWLYLDFGRDFFEGDLPERCTGLGLKGLVGPIQKRGRRDVFTNVLNYETLNYDHALEFQFVTTPNYYRRWIL
ncbi:hypothetical protein M501DRAFT_1035123 [Patellaria atrata CBS 101060]|uniref:Uncharacterized protein n=1 Tax=Patellaria atrata CBS 101060 TaxID=1346257 RepID=A0A9P4VKR4_9PEZI|nr:hypothetical protein M501DRAFT_1035123 [Patellaria atrata CBS 101060]